MLLFLIVLGIIASVSVYFRGSGVPAFLYHQINDHSNVNKKLFEEHLEYIHSKDLHTFTISEARKQILAHGSLPRNSVLITFDDGYYDNYLHVFPLLKRYKMKATFFLNTLFIQEKADRSSIQIMKSEDANRQAIEKFYLTGDGGTDQYMSWEEIREMQASGLCDFQAHTHSHKLAVANLNLRNFLGKGPYDRETIQLFEGKPEEGLPLFRSRGEMTISKYKFSQKFLDDFKDFYKSHLTGVPRGNKLFKGKQFILSYKDSIAIHEKTQQTEERIRAEIRTNKQAIETHLKNEVFAFAWPYGAKSNFTKTFIRKENISAFVSCKKGTNSRKINFNLVRRIELRKPTLQNFKLALNINLNLVSGKIYEFFT
jgi:peptidoglycan/xylan/chitin deacetylase (PgdA/CDA1 family)